MESQCISEISEVREDIPKYKLQRLGKDDRSLSEDCKSRWSPIRTDSSRNVLGRVRELSVEASEFSLDYR
ncbi:unnamed protein product [Bursaphelenchus xylophilus]|uniref:(pine wood nematode) hypothetical protein n=1 Tax=Bursaphelenchus xylophilus TaxID=6326 RepID=A0A1I7SR02_BURXY|nr:unnamed protein product [Bursaphelenchus xylophilus]CAG9110642.1 unnamed protein product [Bursaphelenchus xylophilus]